jgi:hypothetical protein
MLAIDSAKDDGDHTCDAKSIIATRIWRRHVTLTLWSALFLASPFVCNRKVHHKKNEKGAKESCERAGANCHFGEIGDPIQY